MTTTKSNRFAAGCAWIEGDYVPIAEARIPILDAGFVHSDLTYDVAAVWRGRFFRLDDHLDRVLRGCQGLRLAPPKSKDEIRAIMTECVRRSGLRDAYVEVIVTRGVPGPGERDSRLWTPRLYAYAVPYVWIVQPDVQEQRGVDVVVARNTRRIPPGAANPQIKNFQWGDFVRATYEAYDRGGSLGLLPDGDGMITEGAGFNVFALVDGILRTPERGVLHGITRRTVIEIAQEWELPLRVDDLPVGELYRASEMFLTSTAGGIMPVTNLDGVPVGEATIGPLTAKIRARYWNLHTDPRLSFPVGYRDTDAIMPTSA
ncbi:MAG: aminotransferase class IV [Actinomycetota bacterium]|nr:aminotransferase class IV [Actinomycetota bacterium]